MHVISCRLLCCSSCVLDDAVTFSALLQSFLLTQKVIRILGPLAEKADRNNPQGVIITQPNTTTGHKHCVCALCLSVGFWSLTGVDLFAAQSLVLVTAVLALTLSTATHMAEKLYRSKGACDCLYHIEEFNLAGTGFLLSPCAHASLFASNLSPRNRGNLCDKPGNCPCIPPGSTRKTVAQDACDQVGGVTGTQKKHQIAHGQPHCSWRMTAVAWILIPNRNEGWQLLKGRN